MKAKTGVLALVVLTLSAAVWVGAGMPEAGWVVMLAPLLATALVFRRVPTVSLGIVGVLLGLAWVSMFAYVGREEDPLGMLGMVLGFGGIVVGAGIGHIKRRDPTWVRDGSVATIGLAMSLGFVGLLLGGFIPALLQQSTPDMDVDVIVAAALGGGVGWCVGARVAWVRTRDAILPGVAQRWSLYVMALTIAILGTVVSLGVRSGVGGPSFDGVSRHDAGLPIAAAVVLVDTALAVVTVLAAAMRRRITVDA
jgi:hypothetical protein